MLKKNGIIDLEIECLPEKANVFPTPHMAEVTIDNRIVAAYDLLDGYNFSIPDVEKYLAGVDFYFKRSFNAEYHKHFAYASKIHPLGFNYHVTVPGNPVDAPQSAMEFAARNLNILLRRNLIFDSARFEAYPKRNNATLVVCLTRAWDPDELPDLSEELKEERRRINNLRKACILSLRQVFGEKFVGGFNPSVFAVKYFPQYLADHNLVRRSNFISLVKKASTCVATMGLHESNGWKLAEYIAASKPIASERLRYDVPGNFSKGDHYLEFETVEECVNQVLRLEEDKSFAYRMSVNNYEYYHNYLRADKLVLNSLIVALKNEKPGLGIG